MKTIVMTQEPTVELLCRRAVAEYLLDSVVAVPHLTATQAALKNNGPHITGIIIDLLGFKTCDKSTLERLLKQAHDFNPYLHLYYLIPARREERLKKIVSDIHSEEPFQHQSRHYIIAARLNEVEELLGAALTNCGHCPCSPCYHLELHERLSIYNSIF